MAIEIIEEVENSNYKFEYQGSIWKNIHAKLKGMSILRIYEVINHQERVDMLLKKMAVKEFIPIVWNALKNTYKMYVFCSTTNFNPNTRVSNYYALWKGLSKQYPEINSFHHLTEIKKHRKGKHRFSGIAHIRDENLINAIKFVYRCRTSAIFFCREDKASYIENLTTVLFDAAFGKNASKYDHILNLPDYISSAFSNGLIPLNIYGSNDYGGIYLDLFFKNKQDLIGHVS